MKKIEDNYNYKGIILPCVFYTSSKLPKEKYSQVYSLAFTDSGKILIITSSDGKRWGLPGGKPEGKETYKQTAIREAEEESSVEISNVKILGYAKVNIPKNDIGLKTGVKIQIRCFAKVKKINKMHKDPDGGILRKRKFVSPKDFTKYVKWGKVGEKLIELAVKEFEFSKISKKKK